MNLIRKRRPGLMVLLCLCLLFPTVAGAAPPPRQVVETPIHVNLDGRALDLKVLATPANLVPLRAVAEQLGAEVKWLAETRTVHIAWNNHIVTLPLNGSTAEVDGRPVALDVLPVIYGDRTYVPINFLAEALGLTVTYEQDGATLNLTSKEKPASTQPTKHPLDPLSADELQRAVAFLKQAGVATDSTRFVQISLHEPAKADVLAFKPGQPMGREAFVILYDRTTHQTTEVVVDLNTKKLVSNQLIPNVQPPSMVEDEEIVAELVKQDPRWLAAIAKRGIADLDKVQFDIWAGGYFGIPDEEGRRILRAPAYYVEDPTNMFARPIEGLVAYVDTAAKQVLHIIDTGVVPIPVGEGRLDAKSNNPSRTVKPFVITQPDGVGFQVDGHAVAWQNWHFRWSVHPRSGLTLHTVGYQTGTEVRPVLYNAALSEMVVPYSDPDETFYWRNAFDVGEYGLGINAHTLDRGKHCPSNAAFFDAQFMDNQGEPYTLDRSVCIFERDGDLTWTHYDMTGEHTETRRGQELVIRFMAVIGNYDYGLDWIFHPDGTLEQSTTATGILEPKGVHSHTLADDKDGHETRHGQLVAPNVVAPNHQHFFNFRLDLDVDGTQNSVIETNVGSTPAGPANPGKGGFEVTETILRSERAAMRDLSLGDHREWRVVSASRKNQVGATTGYKLLPGENAVPYADPTAWVRKRAGFMDHHLWVTPLQPRELYAAGDYPNQSKGGDGLPAWTATNRPVENRDVVLWYTMGLTHITRPEEWPIMPAHRLGFKLVPVNFFDRNPSMDLPN